MSPTAVLRHVRRMLAEPLVTESAGADPADPEPEFSDRYAEDRRFGEACSFVCLKAAQAAMVGKRITFDAEDIAQDTYLRWRSLAAITLKSIRIAYKIARGLVTDGIRSRGVSLRCIGEAAEIAQTKPAVRWGQGSVHSIAEREVAARVENARFRLPFELEIVVHLHDVENLPFERVGDALGISGEAARKRHLRACELIALLLRRAI